MGSRLEKKILSRAELVERFGRPSGQRVVFTNGCFDVLHRGHVEYLAEAREMGDALVVGLNSDASVCRLKGPDRPLNAEHDRAIVLAALESVDAVTIFPEDTPLELISELLPDVLVKGGDYQVGDIVGAKQVENAGGRVAVVPLVPDRSTTRLIQRMKEGHPHE